MSYHILSFLVPLPHMILISSTSRVARLTEAIRRTWGRPIPVAVKIERDLLRCASVRWRLLLLEAVSGWVRVDFSLHPVSEPVAPRLIFKEVLDVYAFRHPRTTRYSAYLDLDKTGRHIAIDSGNESACPITVAVAPTSEWAIALATMWRHTGLIPGLIVAAARYAIALASGRSDWAAYLVRTAVLRVSASKNASTLTGASAYAAMIANEPPAPTPAPSPQPDESPVVSLVLDAGDSGPDALRATLRSLVAQSHGNWELLTGSGVTVGDDPDPRIRSLTGDRRVLFDHARGAYVSWISAGDRLAPNAVERVAAIVERHPNGDRPALIYADEDRCDSRGRRSQPFLKPDWSPEYFESTFYTSRFAGYRLDRVRDVGGLRLDFGEAAEYELALRIMEGGQKAVHLSEVLYHRQLRPPAAGRSSGSCFLPVTPLAARALQERMGWEDGGTAEWVGNALHALYAIRGQPTLSVIIPTAGRSASVRGRTIDLLSHCIRSLQAKGGWEPVEWVVVHNNDLRRDTLSFLERISAKLVAFHGNEVNLAVKMNLGARAAAGEILLFLNDDIEAWSEGVFAEMIRVVQRPGVGAVGAKLYFEDGTIQHGGVALAGALPYQIYSGGRRDDPGYFGALEATRNTFAVTGSCLMTTRHAFREAGGFDERLRVNYNDIDLCLKLVECGYRIVFTPHAQLYHFESKSRDPSRMYWEEAEYFARKWAHLANRDPYYSRWFAGSGSFALRI